MSFFLWLPISIFCVVCNKKNLNEFLKFTLIGDASFKYKYDILICTKKRYNIIQYNEQKSKYDIGWRIISKCPCINFISNDIFIDFLFLSRSFKKKGLRRAHICIEWTRVQHTSVQDGSSSSQLGRLLRKLRFVINLSFKCNLCLVLWTNSCENALQNNLGD